MLGEPPAHRGQHPPGRWQAYGDWEERMLTSAISRSPSGFGHGRSSLAWTLHTRRRRQERRRCRAQVRAPDSRPRQTARPVRRRERNLSRYLRRAAHRPARRRADLRHHSRATTLGGISASLLGANARVGASYGWGAQQDVESTDPRPMEPFVRFRRRKARKTKSRLLPGCRGRKVQRESTEPGMPMGARRCGK